MSLRIRQTPSVKPTTKARMAARVRLASLTQLSERKFFERVRDLESDPLFQKLASGDAVIRCRRFPAAGFAGNVLTLLDGTGRDTGGVDVESLLASHGAAAALIRKIGAGDFEKYFLYRDETLSAGEAAGKCGLSASEARAVADLVNELSVRVEFFHPSRVNPGMSYRKVAAIEYDGRGGPLVCFFSPRYCSGKYIIDYDRFEALELRGEEQVRARRLFRELELINVRAMNLYRILHLVAGVQREYIVSGDERELTPYSRKEAARALDIDESLVSRAVSGRSVVIPNGTEKPLKEFFPSHKEVRKILIRGIVEGAGARLTDEGIRLALKERFGIDVSRRTVNACRGSSR